MTTKKSTGKLYHSDSHSLTNNRTASGCKPSRSKTYYAVRTGPYIGIWDDWNSIVVLKAAFPHTKYETYDSLARAESFTGMTGLREPITRDSFREMLQRRAAKRVGHSNGNHPVLVTRKLSNGFYPGAADTSERAIMMARGMCHVTEKEVQQRVQA